MCGCKEKDNKHAPLAGKHKLSINLFAILAALFCITQCSCFNLPEEYSVRHHDQFLWSSPPCKFRHNIDTTGISLKDHTFVPTISIYDFYNSISNSSCQDFNKLKKAEVADVDFTPGAFLFLAIGDTFSIRVRAHRPIIESGIQFTNSSDIRLLSRKNELTVPDSAWEYISQFSFLAIRKSKGYIHFHSLNDDSPRNTVCYCTETPDHDSVAIDSITFQMLVDVNSGDTIVNKVSIRGWTNASMLGVSVNKNYYYLYNYYYNDTPLKNESNQDGTFAIEKYIRLRIQDYVDPLKLIIRGTTGLDHMEYLY